MHAAQEGLSIAFARGGAGAPGEGRPHPTGMLLRGGSAQPILTTCAGGRYVPRTCSRHLPFGNPTRGVLSFPHTPSKSLGRNHLWVGCTQPRDQTWTRRRRTGAGTWRCEPAWRTCLVARTFCRARWPGDVRCRGAVALGCKAAPAAMAMQPRPAHAPGCSAAVPIMGVMAVVLLGGSKQHSQPRTAAFLCVFFSG